MLNAFSYMFKDKDFWKKGLIPLVINYICTVMILIADFLQNSSKTPILLVLCLTALLLEFIPGGYFYSCVKSLINKEIEIPYIDVKKAFYYSFKMLGAGLILGFAIGILTTVLSTVGLIFTTIGLKSLGGLLLLLIFLTGIIAFAVLLPAFVYVFAKEELITIFFQLKKVCSLVSQNKSLYTKGMLLCWFVLLLSGLINSICQNLATNYINITFVSLVMAIFATYFLYVTSYIVANSIKETNLQETNN